ncbi:MAG TPA: hypothetical protein VIL48_06170 [Acidimicrobiales bacterium]
MPGAEAVGLLAGPAAPAADWPAPRQVPTTYPGAAPDHHYLLVDDRVVPLEVRWDGAAPTVTLADGRPLDAALAAAGLPELAERIPVLAYGANRSPHSLALKLAHHGYDAPGGTVAVPVLAGAIAGLDVVVAGLSSQGFVYADVVPSPGTEISVLLTLLDPGQVAAVHDSEGVGRGAYECARLPGFTVAGTGRRLDVLAYAGCKPVFVSPVTGGPLAFAAIAATGRRFAAHDQVELMGRVLAETGIVAEVAALVGLDAGRPPAEVGRELARLLSGQWWYSHNTGDEPMATAVRAEELVWAALGRFAAPQSTAERLGAEGALLSADEAYAAGPELRLGAQLGA